MNIHAPLDHRAYDARMWSVMLAGCAARFSAERTSSDALAGFLLWALIFAACWIIRSRLRANSASPARVQQAGNIVAIIGGLLFLLQLNAAGLIPALLVFLFAIQAALFVTASKRLHAWLIATAGLTCVLFAAAESRSSLFLICAIWFTFATMGLLALDHRHDRERLMLLQPPQSETKHAGIVAFASIALLCTIPLYLFIPKPSGLMLGGMQASVGHDDRPDPDAQRSEPNSPSAREASPFTDDATADESDDTPLEAEDAEPARPEEGDYGESFSVADVQRDRARGNAIVMYVKSSSAINLRGLIYDRFENHRWHRDPRPFADHALDRGNLHVTTRPLGRDGVKQSIEVVRNLDSTLVHAPGLSRLRFPGPSVRRYDDDVFVAPEPLHAATTYSLESRLGVGDGRYFLASEGNIDLARYLDASAASDRMRELAQRVTASIPTPRVKALMLESFLRTEYQYSYETIEQQGYTPLDWFLFEGRRGHCEYFASALAMLLRTVGIPSRVATGFSLSAPNPVTGYYEVRALDGHAWVEAFIDGYWLMLEPTPFYPLPQPRTEGQVADQLDGYLDRLAQTSAVIDPQAATTQLALLARDAWRQVRQTLRAIASVPRMFGWLLPAGIILGALLTVVAYIVVMGIADWLENRAARTTLARAGASEAREATLLAAEALQVVSAPRGGERHAGASFREYLDALGRTGIVVPAQFADDFDIARYGSEAETLPASSTRQVSELIVAHMAADPWPRVRRTWNGWHRWVLEATRR
jgi:transglutaminase-like putative cysteine protease